jgi:hypothetical protein
MEKGHHGTNLRVHSARHSSFVLLQWWPILCAQGELQTVGDKLQPDPSNLPHEPHHQRERKIKRKKEEEKHARTVHAPVALFPLYR